MLRKTLQSHELGASMVERTKVLTRMKERRLNYDLVREFGLSQLTECCNRMSTALTGIHVCEVSLQKELIQNPEFAAYYAELLPMLPGEPLVEKTPEPTRNTSTYGHSRYHPYYNPTSRPVPSLRRRAELTRRLCDLVEQCWANKRSITGYQKRHLLQALELDQVDAINRLIFLDNFSAQELPEDERQVVAENLSTFASVPLKLSEEQRMLLREPFISTQSVLFSSEFEEVWTLLEKNPELLNIIQFLHQKGVLADLNLKDYREFVPDTAERYNLMTAIINQLEPETATSFIQLWKRGGCSMYELQCMDRRMAMHPNQNWDDVFSNYSGYVNQLYGTRFKKIDLSDLRGYQESVLIYAIIHNKKHFIRLVDENEQVFRNLSSDSMLFLRELYEEHFNLNELTAKDLSDCTWMKGKQLLVDMFPSGRLYTFPELKALYGVSSTYVSFYHMLDSENQDYRLRVFKQLLKRDVLQESLTKEDLAVLADRLNVKPLYNWQQEEFGHIAELTAVDTVHLLIHLDQLKHLLPSIHHKTDAVLTLRNLEVLQQFDSVAALKDNLVQMDQDWRTLAEDMGLSEEFQSGYRNSIIKFLCNNGASIANTYRARIDGKQAEAFLRVVKAELMGQLDSLKYFDGDLQKELDTTISENVTIGWRRNLSATNGSMEIQEHDDFFSTMLLGEQPYRTCMSYKNGEYSECLLSGFDSNKKVLYATLGGRIVGRAYLRLTKGRLNNHGHKTSEDNNGFTFVDLEDISGSRQETMRIPEYITLFLERPYISGVGPDMAEKVKQMFVDLVKRKADELGTILVLSMDYLDAHAADFTQTRFNIYISKTKAGAQYLDSLDGEATIAVEGSYKANTFLIREHNGIGLPKVDRASQT